MNAQDERRIGPVHDWERHVFMLLFVVPVLVACLWWVQPLLGLVVVAVFLAGVVERVHASRRLLERGRPGRAG